MTINKVTDERNIDLLHKVRVRKVSGGKWSEGTVSVVQEMPLTIFLNNREIVTLLCAGIHLKALARIAKILKNSAFRKILMEADTREEIYRTIIQNDEEF